jgi:hypothetical protein
MAYGRLGILNCRGLRLVLTGHSLGGGTAILATYLLLGDPAFQAWGAAHRVECFAFAPPPLLPAEGCASGQCRPCRACGLFIGIDQIGQYFLHLISFGIS